MNRLIELYKELAALTREKCATCDPPFHCCYSQYCDHAKFWAAHSWGIELKEPIEPRGLPFLSSSGCTVPPHMRPVCSIYVCNADTMPERYHELLAEITKEEQERYGRGEWAKDPK